MTNLVNDLRRFAAYALPVLAEIAGDVVADRLGFTHTSWVYRGAVLVVALAGALRLHPNGVNGPAAS